MPRKRTRSAGPAEAAAEVEADPAPLPETDSDPTVARTGRSRGGRRAASPPPPPTTTGRRASARQQQRRSAATAEDEEDDSSDDEAAPPRRKKPRLEGTSASEEDEPKVDPGPPSGVDAPPVRRRGRPPKAASVASGARPSAAGTTTSTRLGRTRGPGRPASAAQKPEEEDAAEGTAPPKRGRGRRKIVKDGDPDDESVVRETYGQEDEGDDSKDGVAHKKRDGHEEEDNDEDTDENSNRGKAAPPSPRPAGPDTSAMTAQLVSNVLNSYTRQSSSRSLATSTSSHTDPSPDAAVEAANGKTASEPENEDGEGCGSESESSSTKGESRTEETVSNDEPSSRTTVDAGAGATAADLSLLASASGEQELAVPKPKPPEIDAQEGMAGSPTGGASPSQQGPQMSPLEFLARSAVAAMTAIPVYAPTEAVSGVQPEPGIHEPEVVGRTVEKEEIANDSRDLATDSSQIHSQEPAKMDASETGEPCATLLTANLKTPEESRVKVESSELDQGDLVEDKPDSEQITSNPAVDTTSVSVENPSTRVDPEETNEKRDQDASDVRIVKVDEASTKQDMPDKAESLISALDDADASIDSGSPRGHKSADESTRTEKRIPVSAQSQDSKDLLEHASSQSVPIEDRQQSAALIPADLGNDQAGQIVPIQPSQDADTSESIRVENDERIRNTMATTYLSSDPNRTPDTNGASELQRNVAIPMDLEVVEAEGVKPNDSLAQPEGVDISDAADSMEIEKIDDIHDSADKQERSSFSDQKDISEDVDSHARHSESAIAEHTNASTHEIKICSNIKQLPPEHAEATLSIRTTSDESDVARELTEPPRHVTTIMEEGSFRADQTTFSASPAEKLLPKNKQSTAEITPNEHSPVLSRTSIDIADMIELMKTGTPIFPPIISDSVVPSSPIKTLRVLSLDRLKLRIYTEGRRSHKGRHYEKCFADYWSAVAQRLENSASASAARKCQSILDQFLNTKRLRKLHNRLILGLLERCVKPHALVGALNDRLPTAWRDRVRVSTWQALHKQADEEHQTSTEEVSDETSISDSGMNSSLFRPLLDECDTSLVNKSETISLNVKSPSISASLPVPGALSIDPYVRAVSSAHGMKVSESAVWLLVIAMKHFISARIGDAVNASKVLESIQQSSTSSATIPSTIDSDKQLSVTDIESNKLVKSIANHCLGAFAFHALSPASLVSSAPTSSPRRDERGADSAPLNSTMRGPISRAAFENGLFNLWNENMGQDCEEFQHVKRFLISKLSDFTPVQERHPSPSSHLPLASMERHAQAATGGLGRGAKDLASLKARTATRSSPVMASVRSSPLTVTTRASPETTSDPMKATALSLDGREGPATSSAAQNDDDKRPTSSPDESDSVHHSLRRGKGFGVKNLAAMRARSVTSLTKAEEVATSEAPASPEATGDSNSQAQHIQADSVRQVDETGALAANDSNLIATGYPNDKEVTKPETPHSVATPNDSEHNDESAHHLEDEGAKLAVNEPNPTIAESASENHLAKTEEVATSESIDVVTSPNGTKTTADDLPVGDESAPGVDETVTQAINTESIETVRSSGDVSFINNTENIVAADVEAEKISEITASSASPGDSTPFPHSISNESSQNAEAAAAQETETIAMEEDKETSEAVVDP